MGIVASKLHQAIWRLATRMSQGLVPHGFELIAPDSDVAAAPGRPASGLRRLSVPVMACITESAIPCSPAALGAAGGRGGGQHGSIQRWPQRASVVARGQCRCRRSRRLPLAS